MECVSVVLFALSGCYVVLLCVEKKIKSVDNKKKLSVSSLKYRTQFYEDIKYHSSSIQFWNFSGNVLMQNAKQVPAVIPSQNRSYGCWEIP